MKAMTSSPLFQSKSIWRFLLIGTLLLSAFALIIVPYAPQVHAATPAVDAQGVGSSGGTSVNTANFNAASTGELLTLFVVTQDTSTGVCGSAIHVTGITYGSAGSWTEVGGTYQCVSRSASTVSIIDEYYTSATSTTPAVVTASFSASVTTAYITVVAWTNSKNYILISSQAGSCNTLGTCSTTSNTTPNAAYAGNDIVIGGASTRGGTYSAAGGGFTSLQWSNGGGGIASCTASSPPVCFEYLIPSSAGTTNYPATLAAGGNVWVVEGMDFGPPGGSTPPFGGTCSASATCTTRSFNVSSNSAIVLAVQSSAATGDYVNTVTDSLGNPYTEWVAGVACSDFPTCANGNAVLNSIWTAPSSVAGSGDKITINFKNAITTGGYEISLVANVNPTPSCVVGAVHTSSASLNTGTACAFSAGSYLFSGLAGLTSNTLTAGAGFTLIGSGLVNMQAQFEQITNVNPPNPAGSTVFPATISAATAVVDGGIVLAPLAGGTGTVIVGSCPTKNTATTTLVNNTEYLWTGSYFNQASITNVQAEIASVNTGHVSPETLIFGIYATTSIGSVSANNPLVLQSSFSKSLSATATPQNFVWAAGASYNLPTGATFAIALLGNSKFVINNSNLAGAFSAGTSGGVLANSITSLTGGAVSLFFCANLNYQAVVTTTTSIVSTSTVTSGGGTASVTVTSTTTATSIDAAVAATTSIGAALLILIILLPAVLLTFALGVTTKSPSAAGMGFVAGLTIGTAIGNRAGLVPFYLVAIMVVVMIFIIIGLLLFSRTQG